MRPSHPIAAATARVRDLKSRVPRERWQQKVKRALIGGFFLAFAIVGAARWTWPWYVVIPVAFVGGHIIASDFTRSGVVFVVTFLKEIWSVVKPSTPGA
jgi:fatty acid desaturase